MPAYQQQLAYRFDARSVATAQAKDVARDRLRELVSSSFYAASDFKAALQSIAADAPGLQLELLAYTPDYDSLQLWNMRDGRVECNAVEFDQGESPIELPEDATDEEEDDWHERNTVRIGRVIERLFPHGNEELGCEDVEALARSSEEAPLTSGYYKARLTEVERLAKRRAMEDLPALLSALADPANAAPAFVEVRKAILRAVTRHDVPEVWDAILRSLKSDPAVRKTVEYVLPRLEGLIRTRPDLFAPLR